MLQVVTSCNKVRPVIHTADCSPGMQYASRIGGAHAARAARAARARAALRCALRARYARAYFSARASEFVGRKLAGRGARARGIPGLFVLQQGYRQADMKKRHLNPPSAELLQVVTSCNNLYQVQNRKLLQVVTSCYKLLQVVTSCNNLRLAPPQVVTSCYKL